VISAALEAAPRFRHSTVAVKLRLALLVSPLVLVTACGGNSPRYADMTPAEGAEQAAGAVSDESKKPGNPFKGRRLKLAKLVRGQGPEGRDARVAVFEVGRRKTCVWLWVDRAVPGATYTYTVDACPESVLRAEGEAIANG